MNNAIEDLMYKSGITAQGCWDEMDAYDRQAVMELVKLVIFKCADIADKNSPMSYPDHGIKIKRYFGVD